MKMKKQTPVKVVAAVIERDGRLLIAKRRQGDMLAGKWEFPGGKIDPGETAEEALKRELHEELNIETEVFGFICSSCFDYEHLSIELLAYRVLHISGDITPLVHDEVRWVLRDDLCSYDFPAANEEIIRRLSSCRDL
ncbi:MAG: (deoxy)nucleoside triphosphate pyrophosphohydrolase [Nitrospirota bacterium]|nr:(deoxy)nucleoside triphosphate pyrophosphohydrolase [Nitrospirota bacterium]